ncbi:MAG: hypothetical protein JWN98_1190 [Abditibacteriota bacterium]|nr:hypothetical protein [Abditibacteriota bacterium]
MNEKEAASDREAAAICRRKKAQCGAGMRGGRDQQAIPATGPLVAKLRQGKWPRLWRSGRKTRRGNGLVLAAQRALGQGPASPAMTGSTKNERRDNRHRDRAWLKAWRPCHVWFRPSVRQRTGRMSTPTAVMARHTPIAQLTPTPSIAGTAICSSCAQSFKYDRVSHTDETGSSRHRTCKSASKYFERDLHGQITGRSTLSYRWWRCPE